MNNQAISNTGRNILRALVPTHVRKNTQNSIQENTLPEILFITSYPPRECGIATYTQDLIKALNNKFSDSFSLKVCALEAGITGFTYPEEVKYVLDSNNCSKYIELAHTINNDKRIELVMVQHEFGLFQNGEGIAFLQFLYRLTKPAVVVFHTVLPNPNELLKVKVRHIAAACASMIVMTQNSAQILAHDYGVSGDKINVIPHGTHLVKHLNKDVLKEKYGLKGRRVLSTFGLLGSGKSIETTLDALPSIIEINPDIVFLVIGKTHPSVKAEEGEQYRNMLKEKVSNLCLQNHVQFVNAYLPLSDLLEYLQLTDIYLFTSKDPNQAVSGTFSYAMSCGCPIVSTPIPHACEVLNDDTGILIDFQNSEQLAKAVNYLMSDDKLIPSFSSNTLHRIVPTVWENSAVAHALLVQKTAGKNTNKENMTKNISTDKISLEYRLPAVNLDHIKKMTTDVGMIQFSKINQPDLESGYTIDDNARALVALSMHYEKTGNKEDVRYIRTYLNFIKLCQQPEGNFLNYVDTERHFTEQNNENLSDANGRAIWALGFLISKSALLPKDLGVLANEILQKALPFVEKMHSTRSMAFIIKGLYYSNLEKKSAENTQLIKTLANRLVQMYRHESEPNWQWFESYLTYGNSILPEAMLCAYLDTNDFTYKKIAQSTFDFLLALTFNARGIKVISNKTWLHKGQEAAPHGEQPIDVAYTIMALSKFYNVFKSEAYLDKMTSAFNWFLGNNHLQQIIYNPCTGGCYDGLEEKSVNLNQGAESTVSYLMARLTIENYRN
jgi:glycosyltransferase involved in cell wall biosynthesis